MRTGFHFARKRYSCCILKAFFRVSFTLFISPSEHRLTPAPPAQVPEIFSMPRMIALAVTMIVAIAPAAGQNSGQAGTVVPQAKPANPAHAARPAPASTAEARSAGLAIASLTRLGR